MYMEFMRINNLPDSESHGYFITRGSQVKVRGEIIVSFNLLKGETTFFKFLLLKVI